MSFLHVYGIPCIVHRDSFAVSTLQKKKKDTALPYLLVFLGGTICFTWSDRPLDHLNCYFFRYFFLFLLERLKQKRRNS